MPAARYGEAPIHACMLDVDGAEHVSKPLPVNTAGAASGRAAGIAGAWVTAADGDGGGPWK
jgi:hypothetical protein